MEPQIAQKYGWKRSSAEKSHSYLIPSVLDLLELETGSAVLDIGTGNGSTLPIWLGEGWHVSGMEPDEEGFNFASNWSEVDLKKIGVEDPIPEEWVERFDGAVSLEVVEHLFNPAALAKFAFDCLKPGGAFVISTPYHGYLKNLALAVFGKWDFHHHPNRVGGHIKFWSKNTLTKLLVDAGFVNIRFTGSGRIPLLWKSMVLVANKPK